VWFKPTDTSFASENEVASGPLISGVDNRGKRWGLYISGHRGGTANQGVGSNLTSTTLQHIRPSYIYHNGNGYTRKTIDITNGGLQIRRTEWTNLILKVTSNVVDFRAGSTGDGMRFQRWRTTDGIVQFHDETNMISLTGGANLPADATNYVNNVRSLASSSPPGGAAPAQLPPDLSDGKPKTNSLFIGLSTIRRQDIIDTWTDLKGNTSGSETLVCGTDDGAGVSDNSDSGVNTYGNNLWLHETALANVAIFNYSLSDSECDEIFAGRGVW